MSESFAVRTVGGRGRAFNHYVSGLIALTQMEQPSCDAVHQRQYTGLQMSMLDGVRNSSVERG